MNVYIVPHPRHPDDHPRRLLIGSTTMRPPALPIAASVGRKETMNDSDHECSDLRVGRVIAITPSQAVILLESRDATGTPDLGAPLEMGTLVKLHSRVS